MYYVCICVFFLCRLIFCKKLFFFLSHRSSFSPFFFFHFGVIGLLHCCCLLCLLATILSSKSFGMKHWNSSMPNKPCKCSTWQPNQFLCLMNEIVKHARIHMMSSQNVIRYFGWSFLFCLRSKTLMNTISISTQSDVKCDELYIYIGVCVCFFFFLWNMKKVCLSTVCFQWHVLITRNLKNLLNTCFIFLTSMLLTIRASISLSYQRIISYFFIRSIRAILMWSNSESFLFCRFDCRFFSPPLFDMFALFARRKNLVASNKIDKWNQSDKTKDGFAR